MLNGTLPSLLFMLHSLQNIYLSDNMFSGGLPTELFNQQSLRNLILRGNQFDGEINVGSTPPSFIQLTNLISLDLSYNSFKGLWELDTLLSSLPNLTGLNLSYNCLSVVTTNATRHANHNFHSLRLASCKLTVFPESLQAMKNLYFLDLSGNDTRGHLPGWAWEIGSSELWYLDLSHNLITGLPKILWSGLGSLYLRSNEIQGPFPPSICNMSYLANLDISNNSFSGLIPHCLENLNRLGMINLASNQFHGTIPNMCKDSSQLEGVLLSGNQLRGDLPTTLSKCLSLKVLDLRNNRLNGTFPSCLGGLKSLEVIIDTFSGTESP